MNRKSIIYTFALLALALTVSVSARQTITPFGRPRVASFDNHKGKSFKYYCLVKGQSLGFAVEGPAEIDVRTRAGLNQTNVTADYQIQVWEEEYLVAAEKFRSKRIDGEMIGSDLFPAAFRKVNFVGQAGVHNYRLWLVSENIDTVFVRIYRSDPSGEKPVKVSMFPLQYFKRVHLYSKRNQTPYYLVNKNDGVKLKVDGPAEMIVRTRANFSNAMEGRIGYTISIMEGDQEINTLSATTSKSLTMAYQDYTGVVPSKPTEFIIDVPAGSHTYDFLLKESVAETVSIRFSLPKQENGPDDTQ
ncbi:MAG: hypothetical protein GY839_13590 [candidate division Zixibacteria bacterium]|nr:hypothetical protein [candidate division Zixibacteria bacterium]